MSDDIIFKKKEEVKEENIKQEEIRSQEIKTERKEIGKSEIDKELLSPLLYKEQMDKPYLAKVYEVENVFDDLPADVLTDIEIIDNYLIKLIKKKELGNTPVDYERKLKYLEKITNTQHYSFSDKIKKIAEFLQILERQKYVRNY